MQIAGRGVEWRCARLSLWTPNTSSNFSEETDIMAFDPLVLHFPNDSVGCISWDDL